MLSRTAILFMLFASLFPASAKADEGMWLLNNFPADQVEKLYGFRPSQSWLDHARSSAVRLAQGCSAAFVSPKGLVQTNHHCAERCIEQLSRNGQDSRLRRILREGGEGRGPLP